ncbi:MAG: right-handed parallel beta-helix repeat-containing protein, partial [Solirubrobacterales bacterium]
MRRGGGKLRVGLSMFFAVALLMPGSAAAATITPDITADELDGSGGIGDTGCSLREALFEADFDSSLQDPDCSVVGPFGNDTIVLPAGTYEVALAPAGEDFNSSGDLDVFDADGLTIQGAGAGVTTIMRDGALVDRPLDVWAGNLDLEGLTVSNGIAPAGEDGGGILVRASAALSISDSTVSGNQTDSNGGGIAYEMSSPSAPSIERSRISGNSAGDLSMGGGVYAAGIGSGKGALAIDLSDSDVSDNTAFNGAGIHSPEPMTITRSRVHDNTATDAGADGFPGGGGFASGFGTGSPLNVTDSAFTGNHVVSTDPNGDGAQTFGAGILIGDGTLILRDSTVAGNDLDNQGTFGIQQQFGAGINLVNGTGATIVNSTISGNTAPAASAEGGGLFAAVPAELIATTFDGNEAALGDAVFKTAAGSVVTMGSVLSGGDPFNVCSLSGGSLVSQGYNVSLGLNCTGLTGPGDAPTTDPMLAPLADNGAPPVGAPGFTASPQT